MESSAPPPVFPLPPPNSPILDSALGGILLGPLISTWIFGVYCLQLYAYWTTRFNDTWTLKSFVIFVFVLEVLHTVEMWESIYEILVKNYGNLAVLIDLPISMRLATIASEGMAVSIQIFFAWRIRTLSQNFIIPGILWGLAVVRAMFALVTTIQSVRIRPVAKFFADWSWAPLGMVAVGCVSDILIAVAMTFYLRRNKNQLKRTTEVLNKLILTAVEAGVFTTILGLALLVSMALMPDNSAWPGIFFIYAKAYSTSLMVSLNARKHLRTQLLSEEQSTFELVVSPRSMGFREGETGTTHRLDGAGDSVVKLDAIHVRRQGQTEP
ncbi:hypothetical protein DL96DRAFT_1220677 [Flagelloscypha sp. PMI_526]|nr:hypothetical protein DL96DRAFT_1220677 [Flagelloscypha sp. PMI_526]